MPDVILVVLDHPAATDGLLSAARRLAELCGAGRINAMLVRAPPGLLVSPSEEVLTTQREAELRNAEAIRADAVHAVFDTWSATAPPGLNVRWIEIEGAVDLLVEEHGRRADYLVVEQSSHHDYGTSWMALRAALFTTDRPVLMMPAGSSAEFGRHIVIAWRDDGRATKAVLSALHCLTRAERVCVLCGTRGGAAPQIPPILGEHGVAAELHVLPIGGGSFGAALLDRAHELAADMLVMGAYQHSPLREFLLGGVTRHMLNHADLPILLRH